MVRDNGDAPTGHAAEGSTPGSRSKDLGLDPTAQLCDAPTGHAAEGSTPGSRSKDLGQDPTNYFFDALMVIGFGGPEGLNEVIPFLERVTAGRGIPRDRLAEVGEHYITFGGVSPVNAQNRTLTEELTKRLEDMGIQTPVVIANRNSPPFIADVLDNLVSQGKTRVLAVAIASFASYSSCRQYREDIAAALAELSSRGVELPSVVKAPPFWHLKGLEDAYVEVLAPALLASNGEKSHGTAEVSSQVLSSAAGGPAFGRMTGGVGLSKVPDSVTGGAACGSMTGGGDGQSRAHVMFAIHSLPMSMASSAGPAGDAYVNQQRDLAARIIKKASLGLADEPTWELVYQSRSGPPHIPWLEPDISDALTSASEQGIERVIVVPISFLTDHMEVIWDLDTEAAQTAQELGLNYERVATPGTNTKFLDSWASWVASYLCGEVRSPGDGDFCSTGCCAGRPPAKDAADAVILA